MPPLPPATPATRDRDDNYDQSPPSSDPAVEIFDSDMEIDDEHEPEEREEEEPEEYGDDNDEEEIEIEVEEEEEEIEEVEVEEEEEEEDTLDSSKEANEKRNDDSQDMESDKQLESQSTPEISKLKLPSNSLVEDNVSNFKSAPSNEPLATQEEESYINYEDFKRPKSGKHMVTAGENGSLESAAHKKDAEALTMKKNLKECSLPHSDSQAHLSNTKSMAAESSDASIIIGKEVAAALSISCLGETANTILDSKEEVEPMEMQSEDTKEQTASRSGLVTSETRTRSRSPSGEFKDGNKRPAVLCDFFAKGWCIRGSSCRFLHVNNKEDDTNQQPEVDEAATTLTSESQFDEGVRSMMEKPSLPGLPDPMGPSIGKDAVLSCHFSSERIVPQEHGASQMLHQLDDKQKFSSLLRERLSWGVPPISRQFRPSKDDPVFPPLLKDVGIENVRQNWPAADCDSYASLTNRGSSPLFQNSFLPEHKSSFSGSVVKSSNYHSGNPSSYSRSLYDPACIRSMHDSSLDTSLSSNGALPSHHISACTGSSFSFSSSFNTSAIGSQKLVDSDRDYHASSSSSLLRSASPFSGSEPENFAPTGVFGDRLCHAEHKTKGSSNDWEPSVPFRPSFFIMPAMIASPGSQYDPLRDSFDLPDIGDKSFKFSFSSQGTSILNSSHQPIYGDSLSRCTLGAECDVDKSTIPYHNRFHGSVLDKNSSTPGKYSFSTGTVTGGTCGGDRQNGIVSKEESASGTYNDKDISKTNKTDHDGRHQRDGSKRKKDLKIDMVRQNSEMEVDQKTDGDVQKESKVLRHFRSALVDFVKELLKPAWREGQISKDAHNTIVKKAADKVLSTMQHHQIPTSMELVKQYLSSAQPKIAKLVEGYITKYGTS